MSVYDALLDVQEQDTALHQLRHRLATLPERAALNKIDAALTVLGVEASAIQDRRDELGRNLKRLEDEAATIEAKAISEDKRLYSGTVTNARELQTIQEEIDGLRRRRSALEDSELELMEEIEPLDAQLAEFDAGRNDLDRQAADLRVALAESEVATEAEIARMTASRAEAVAGVPVELVELYDLLRTRIDGPAVARLEAGRCQGCHLTLPAAEVDRIRHLPADERVNCEQCGALLVR